MHLFLVGGASEVVPTKFSGEVSKEDVDIRLCHNSTKKRQEKEGVSCDPFTTVLVMNRGLKVWQWQL